MGTVLLTAMVADDKEISASADAKTVKKRSCKRADREEAVLQKGCAVLAGAQKPGSDFVAQRSHPLPQHCCICTLRRIQ
jgi:hypothetical protein